MCLRVTVLIDRLLVSEQLAGWLASGSLFEAGTSMISGFISLVCGFSVGLDLLGWWCGTF